MHSFKHLELPRKTNKKKEEYKYFVGSTEKDPLSYKAGEMMVFRFRAKHMDAYLPIPFVHYSLLTEDGKSEEGYKACAEDGWFYIEASISKNGFVYLKAQACDENKQTIAGIEEYNASAGADVKKILCSVKTPEDYAEFWRTMREEVESAEPQVLFSKRIEDESHPDFEIYDMRIRAPRSEYASMIVAYPKNAEKGSLKLAMLFQGYGVNPATPWPMDGYLTVHVSAHSMPNGESPEFYQALRDGALKGYGYNAEENKKGETTYFVKMILRDLAALHFFKDHELLNKKDYIFVGSSQGGMQAINVAANFEKATAVIANVPGFSDVLGETLAGRRKNGMPKGDGVVYYDTAIAAQFIKCPVYIIAGLGDTICAPCTQMALFNAIPSQKYIEFYQNKTHSFTIPWDNCVYTLGDESLADQYKEFTQMYYDWN